MNTRQKVARGLIAAVGCTLTLVACGAPSGQEESASQTGQLVSWEEFKSSVTREVDGRKIYVVEWDLAVTEEELRERYDAYVARAQKAAGGLGETRQGSIVNQTGGVDDIWRGGQQMNLTYCVSDTFGANKARAISEMAQATAAWQREARVQFRYVPAEDASCTGLPSPNPRVVFSVAPWTSSGACAFFPAGGGSPCRAKTLVINFSDLDTGSFYRTNSPNVRTVGVFRHELGHILGLRHEHTRPESGAPATCIENSSWRALTPYDQSSVMHYPWCRGVLTSDLSLTSSDIQGVRQLYGEPVASGWAWVQANGALGAPYTYSSNNGTIVSSRLATGQYGVDFNGLRYSSGTNAQVVAYGSNARCKLFTTPLGNGIRTSVSVLCYGASGAFTDSAFVVLLDRRSGADSSPNGGAFLSTGGGTSPSVLSGWNSTGGVNSVTWDSTGQYYVARLPGLSFSNASVHVTAYGANANRCKISSWGTGLVNVKCFDAVGNAVSSGFSLSYMERGLIPGKIGGHAWITGGAVGAGYAAATAARPACSSSSFSTRANGSYLDVSLTSSDFLPSSGPNLVPMITGYGSSSHYCNIMSWGASSGTGTVTVGCFDQTGAAVNASSSAFTTTITNAAAPGPC